MFIDISEIEYLSYLDKQYNIHYSYKHKLHLPFKTYSKDR